MAERVISVGRKIRGSLAEGRGLSHHHYHRGEGGILFQNTILYTLLRLPPLVAYILSCTHIFLLPPCSAHSAYVLQQWQQQQQQEQ